MAKKTKGKPRGLSKPLCRLLDANVNRAAEGLRVIEETARFVFESASLYKKIRRLRHEVGRLTAEIYPFLIEARDSQADHGRSLKEGARASMTAVVAANFKRAEEALRVLEEYGKVFAPAGAARFKSVRYALYTMEKQFWKNPL